MRIIIPVIDFGRSGGYRVLSRLASEWSRSTDVQFIAPAFANEPYYPTDAPTTHVDRLGRDAPRRTRNLAGLSRISQAQLALALGLRRHVKAMDVVLSNHFLTTLAAAAVRRPDVTHVRLMQATEADYYPGSGLKAWTFRKLARRADMCAPHALVNSPEFLIGDTRRLGVVPPGVDRDVFFARHGAHIGPLVIGTIGRTEPWKGTDRVLSALLRCSLPAGTRISVANFGADLHPYRDLPIDEALPRSDHELALWYRGLDLYVVGAYGQPGAYHYPCLEALSCGAPVVSPWYRPADDRNAWIVASTEADTLAAGIQTALNSDDRERESRRSAGVQVAEAHSWPRLAAAALVLIKRAAELDRLSTHNR